MDQNNERMNQLIPGVSQILNLYSIDMEQESIVTFNVGGTIFQTLESTLTQPKGIVTKLVDMEYLEKHWDEERSLYFFDRDPTVFQTVVNYMRTGILHLPANMCSPLITRELRYWGLPSIEIQPCCWKDYSVGVQALQSLRKLERDRKPAYANPLYFSRTKIPSTSWGKFKFHMWNTMSDPNSSAVARVYADVSLFFIAMSIINFALNTTLDDSSGSKSGETPTMEIITFRNGSVNQTFSNGAGPGVFSFLQQDPQFPAVTKQKESGQVDLAPFAPLIFLLEATCAIFFFVDLVLRLVTTPDMCHFLQSLHFWVDLLALTPDILHVLRVTESKQATVFELLRFMRLFRVLRLIIRLTGVVTIFYTLYASSREILSMMLVLGVSTLVFSSVVFYAELANGYEQMPSVFHTCWWGIITLTTVGYGDVVPQSVLGQTIGSLCAFAGVILLGITVPTMVINFITFSSLIHYIHEKEQLFFYRRKGDCSVPPQITCPDWI